MLNDIIRKLDKTDNDLYVTVILGFLRTHENTKVVFSHRALDQRLKGFS